MLIAARFNAGLFFQSFSTSGGISDYCITSVNPVFMLCGSVDLHPWKNTELKRISHVACLIICYLVFSIYSFISLALESFHEVTTPVTDIGQYENTLAE